MRRLSGDQATEAGPLPGPGGTGPADTAVAMAWNPLLSPLLNPSHFPSGENATARPPGKYDFISTSCRFTGSKKPVALSRVAATSVPSGLTATAVNVPAGIISPSLSGLR